MTVEQRTIGHLIEVPEVRTVVQMADLENEHRRRLLAENFLITREVAVALRSLLGSIRSGEGRGFFLEGNFGAGKSHLLGILHLLLADTSTWDLLVQQDHEELDFLAEAAKDLRDTPYLVLTVSLVEHSQREYLEDIVLQALQKTLGQEITMNIHDEDAFRREMEQYLSQHHSRGLEAFLREQDLKRQELFQEGSLTLIEELLHRLQLPYRLRHDRQQIFQELPHIMDKKGYRGLIILIDELSEFLRSKPDSRRFNEDIRFLQFLGEYCQRQGAWVVASLQEEIEKTGETTPEAFNKIKDRYPTRLRLTGAHIKELIAQRLIRLQPGAREEVAHLYSRYSQAFPHWPVGKEEFIHLYPVHPGTIYLLDTLKPLFSRHRGIVDFIHYRLRGHGEREIPGMLEAPMDTLLTPDAIFDHFAHRIREMMETSPYYEKVYEYFRKEMDNIVPPEDKDLALAIIKLLILFAISPLQRPYTVQEIANMLLHRITDLDASVNYEHIAHLLERLHQGGAYLTVQTGDTPLKNIYSIDLEADVQLIIKNRLEYSKRTLFAEDHRLFTRLGQEVEKRHLPLKHLLTEPRTTRTITWQNTERRGIFLLADLRELSREDLEIMGREMEENDEDFILIMGQAHRTEEAKRHLQQHLLPHLDPDTASSLAFWLPEDPKEEEFRKEVLARILLLEEYQEDQSGIGKEIQQRLQSSLEEDGQQLSSLFATAYYNGTVCNGLGEELMAPSESGYLPFQHLLERILAQLLSRRFPRHVHIAPYSTHISPIQLQELEEQFILMGEIPLKKAAETGLNRPIDAFMKPMDLVKKSGANLQLHLQPGQNPLLKELFSALEEERTPVHNIYRFLRQGPYGLSKRPFHILLISLIYGGYITPYSEKQRISLKGSLLANFHRIKYIGHGQLIDGEFQEVLADCHLLPKKVRAQPFSLPLQQEAWQHLTELKGTMMPRVENLKAMLQNEENQALLSPFDQGRLLGYIKTLERLLEEIKVSYTSREGLERFAAQYRQLPHIQRHLEYFHALEEFFKEHLSSYAHSKGYLEDESLHIPQGEAYTPLKEARDYLIQSLTDDTILLEKGAFTRVQKAFAQFQRDYQKQYIREHEQQVGGKRLHLYSRIRNEKGYEVLSQLAQLQVLSVEDDLIKVHKLLAQATEYLCSLNPLTYLHRTPTCHCGFQLGNNIELPSPQTIHQVLQRGVSQYLQALQSGEHRKAIQTYVENMKAAGETHQAQPLEELLSIQEDSEAIPKLHKLLNRNSVQRLNQALMGDISIQERSIEDLQEQLLGRSFSPQQLETIFQQWLQGPDGLGKNTYIKVRSHKDQDPERSLSSQDSTALREVFTSHYPDLLPLLQRGMGDTSLLLALVHWESSWLDRETALQILHTLQSHPQPLTKNEYHSLRPAIEDLLEQFKTGEQYQEAHASVLDTVDQVLEERGLETLFTHSLPSSDPLTLTRALQKELFSRHLCRYLFKTLIPNLQNGSNRVLEQVKNNLKQGQTLKGPEEKGAIMELARHYVELEQSLQALAGEKKPQDMGEWARLYEKHLASLEMHLAILEDGTRKEHLEDQVPLYLLKKRVQDQIQNWHTPFQHIYKKWSQQAQIEGDTHTLPYLLLHSRPRFLNDLNRDRMYIFLLDGMRWDLWKLIQEDIVKTLPLRLVQKGYILAFPPANTETQLEALQAAGFTGNIAWPEKESFTLPQEDNTLIKLEYMDTMVHTHKEDYATFLQDIRYKTEHTLLPLLKQIPPASPLLFCSDHGFRINHHFRMEDKYEQARYLHDSLTFFEVLLPWALYYRL